MGVIAGTGSPRFLQSPLSLPFPSSHRSRRRSMQAMASTRGHDESPPGSGGGNASSQRRALLLVGISILPFCQLRAVAAAEEELVKVVSARRWGWGRGGGRGRVQEPGKSMENPEANKEDLGNPEAQGLLKLPEQEISSQVPTEPEVGKEDIGTREAQGPRKPQQEILSQEYNQPEQIPVQNAPGNQFISLLNQLGIICSGVLGSLYATSLKEKTTMESTIESMKSQLTEKDAATALLKKNFETILLNKQEETRKQVRRLEEGGASLSAQLTSANRMIAALRQDLQSEKYLTEELKARVSQLEHAIVQTGENRKVLETKLSENRDTIDVLQDKISLLSLEISDKEKIIETLNSSLAEKESEYKSLNSICDQTKSDLTEANYIVEKLKMEIFKIREELDSEKYFIDGLNDKIKSLHAEKEESDKKLCDLVEEYNDLKSSSARERALNSELLSKKAGELQQLEEKLGLALGEASTNQAMIAELTEERDRAKVILEEVNGMPKLKEDLKISQEALGASRLEVSKLSEELEEAKKSYEELSSKVSEIHDEINESKKLLNSELDKEKSTSKVLSDELKMIKDVLKRTEEELDITFNDLKTVMEDRENLQQELVDIYKKVGTTAHELKEERKLTAALNRELEVLGQQMLKDSEARRALEADLDEATISLDEMNKSTLLLSKELEDTHCRTSSLESEKEMLLKSLTEQKNVAKEAQENIEDAHNLITRLGSERELLEKRSRRLEEDLAAAKGEILRLRRQISMHRESVNEHHRVTNEIGAETPSNGVKKTASRRKKGGLASEDS